MATRIPSMRRADHAYRRRPRQQSGASARLGGAACGGWGLATDAHGSDALDGTEEADLENPPQPKLKATIATTPTIVLRTFLVTTPAAPVLLVRCRRLEPRRRIRCPERPRFDVGPSSPGSTSRGKRYMLAVWIAVELYSACLRHRWRCSRSSKTRRRKRQAPTRSRGR
jgi:hypothetical protein